MTRWINHAVLLLNGQDAATSRAFFRALSRQATFLARRRRATQPGLPRFEALCGLIHAGLSLQGMERHLRPALKALARECAARIDAEGGVPSRSPEDLLEVFVLLAFTLEALSAGGIEAPPALRSAVERIAPSLRTLRHADGGLARFHGGGRGVEGRLDQALAAAGVRHLRHKGLSMGYARLSQGRTTVIVDAAPPPRGRGRADRACLDAGLRADHGPAATDRELRLGRQLRHPVAAGGTGHGVAFDAGDRGLFLVAPRRRGADLRPADRASARHAARRDLRAAG